MVCVFNVDELMLEFVDGCVTTNAFLCVFKVGVKMFGVTKTEISCLSLFFSFFMGCDVNANEVGGVSPWQNFSILAIVAIWI